MENKNLRDQMSELLNGLTEEQKEKAKACKTPEELMVFWGKLGVALPDELLDAVAGGTLFEWLLLEQGIDIRDSTGQDQACGDPETAYVLL